MFNAVKVYISNKYALGTVLSTCSYVSTDPFSLPVVMYIHSLPSYRTTIQEYTSLHRIKRQSGAVDSE